MTSNRLPNFIIVGAAKSATTSLYKLLDQHPDIYMSPQKETNFFCEFGEHQFTGPGDEDCVNRPAVRSLDQYRELFAEAGDAIAVGEASPAYLYYYQDVIPRMRALLGTPRIVMVLRHPVERAFSGYLHTVRDGREILSFEQALELEPERIAAGWEHLWHHTQLGFYAAAVEAYYDAFGPENVLVMLYEDVRRSTAEAVHRVHEFLGVRPARIKDATVRYNRNPEIRRRTLGKKLEKNPRHPLRAMLAPLWRIMPGGVRELVRRRVDRKSLLGLAPQTRRQLVALYRDDIHRLEKLLQRDLHEWLR